MVVDARRLWAHILGFFIVVLGCLQAQAQPAVDDDPWSGIEGNMRWGVGAHTGRTPQGTPAFWRTQRKALEMSAHTLAYTGRDWLQTHHLILSLSKKNLLAWEAGFIARTHDAGDIDADLAYAWVQFLERWASLNDAERVQQHAALRLRLMGAALGSLSPDCLPEQLPDAQYLIELAEIETSIPGRRLRSRVEPPPIQPQRTGDSTPSSTSEDAVYAGTSLVALLSPASPVLAQWHSSVPDNTDACATRYARALFALLLDPQIDGSQALDDLAAQSTAFPIASRWLWRLAIHRYLMGDTLGVQRISAYYRTHYPGDSESVEIMHVLSDIAGESPSEARTDWPAADAGSNPTYQWISAEAARRRGQNAAAEEALTRITDADVHFVAAWISLAAARSALARGRGVHIVLQTLEEIAPPLPIYDYWRTTLRARTGP